jgi:hypothetical protein
MRGDAQRGRKQSDIKREASAFKERILDYLEVFGPATNKTMSAEFGCTIVKLRSKLCVMAAEGEIHSVLIPSPYCKVVAEYHFGPGESSNNREITQRTVHKWKPQKIKHDPLHANFFGIQK